MQRQWNRLAGIAVTVVACLVANAARADTEAEQIRQLRAQLEQTQAQMRQMAAKLDSLLEAQAQAQATAGAATPPPAPTPTPTPTHLDANGHGFFEHKDGRNLTFFVPHGETTLYGNVDISLDAAAKNVGSEPANYAASPPIGNFGWMPDISTNLSYLGVRGFQVLGGDTTFRFVYQFEAGFDLSATPGLKETNSQQSNTVNGALFNRNTFVGFLSPRYGAIKLGKEDSPYKQSTAALDPFLGELGDYGAIMGNTGGDSRVEFGTRLDHSIWYESPTVHGFAINLLFSPGQNRADDSGNLAAGESDCTGGNIPESGGDQPIACNDGAWSNALSGSLSFTDGPLYLTVAGELHQKVNRQSDISGMFGTGAVLPDAYSQALYDQDIANEWAAKVAAKYTFPTDTMLGGVLEYLHRDVPADLAFQNERTRAGAWLVISQRLTAFDSVHVGWAHAFRTPGDPGQHNDGSIPTIDGLGSYATNQNQSDLLTFALKHLVTPDLSLYADWAMINNGPSAHFALGAGGRGVVTDCHDASDAAGGGDSNPHCYTGQTIMGVSAGIKYTF